MTIDDAGARALCNGQGAKGADDAGADEEREQRRAYNGDGVFLAIVEYRADSGLWQPTRVFQRGAPSPYAPA